MTPKERASKIEDEYMDVDPLEWDGIWKKWITEYWKEYEIEVEVEFPEDIIYDYTGCRRIVTTMKNPESWDRFQEVDGKYLDQIVKEIADKLWRNLSDGCDRGFIALNNSNQFVYFMFFDG